MRTLSGRLALPLIAQLRRDGEDPESLLEKLALSAEDLRAFGSRLPLDAWLDLRQASIDRTEDPTLPLRAALGLDRDSFPLGFYIMGSQATLRDGYQFVRPYFPIIMTGLEVSLVTRGERSHVEFSVDDAPLGPPAFAEYLVAIVIALGRLLTPDAPPPTEIVFAHRWPRHTRELSELLGAPTRFGGGAVQMVFPEARIATPIQGADPHLGQLLAQQADEHARASADASNTRVRDRAPPLPLPSPRGSRTYGRRARRRDAHDGAERCDGSFARKARVPAPCSTKSGRSRRSHFSKRGDGRWTRSPTSSASAGLGRSAARSGDGKGSRPAPTHQIEALAGIVRAQNETHAAPKMLLTS